MTNSDVAMLSLMALGAFSLKASANDCAAYTQMSRELPASAQRIFQAKGVIMVCRSPGGQAPTYFLRRPAWKGRADVCHFEEQQLVEIKSTSGEKILVDVRELNQTSAETHSYMMISKDSCPGPADKRYVPTVGITVSVRSGHVVFQA